MGRTRLVGIEVAGVRIAIEVPSSVTGEWPMGRLEPFRSTAHDHQVYVGVRIGKPVMPSCDSVLYACEGATFEIGRLDGDWVIGVSVRGQRERVARFNSDFSQGEVILSGEAVARGCHPLAHPLDELLCIHRIVREGGLVVQGSAVIRDNQALVFFGSEPGGHAEMRSPSAGSAPSPTPAGHSDRLVLRIFPTGVRLYGTPWHTGGLLMGPVHARLDAIHVIRGADAVSAERLDEHEACAELLSHAFAPIHDPETADRIGEIAAAIAIRTPTLRLGLPDEQRVVPFTWGDRQASLAFSPPFV